MDEVSRRRDNAIILAYRSFGIVFCQLSINPLFVYKSTFSSNFTSFESETTVFGFFSLIFWTLTLISLFKYACFMLFADDNGEGGLFALYSLLCRHAKFCLLPNRQAADEELSTYFSSSLPNRSVPVPSKKTRTLLLLLVLFGASMVVAYGFLTPAIAVASSIEGLEIGVENMNHGLAVWISCIILVGIFVLPYWGTHRVAFTFAPIVILWLLTLAAIGVYNIVYWNPYAYRALSPVYIFEFFKTTGKHGWLSLGGILLSVAGSEVIFAYLGRFTSSSIRLAFCVFVYPCLVLQYMGQAAFLSVNFSEESSNFFHSIPDKIFWFVVVMATLASVVASQAVIAATFSILRQSHALWCFPRIKIVHKSKWIDRQIFIPETNWVLMILSLAVVLSVKHNTHIANAYGMVCVTMMLATTILMSLVITSVWRKSKLVAFGYASVLSGIEIVFLSSLSVRFLKGGWITIALSAVTVFIMYVWHYGTTKKYIFDVHNKVPMKWVLNLNNDALVRVPGIGLIYTELASGVPSVFSRFLTNLPSFYKVIVFVCVKTVPVPSVPFKERYLVGRVGPKAYRMYRCIVRYGYKDILENQNDYEFENTLVVSIAEFIKMEEESDGMAVVRRSAGFGKRFEMEADDQSSGGSSSMSSALARLKAAYEEAESVTGRRRAHFKVCMDDDVAKDELLDLVESDRAGVAYVVGHSRVKAKWSASFFKRFVVNIAFSFLRKNCRSPSVFLKIPQSSLIEVGMNYYL